MEDTESRSDNSEEQEEEMSEIVDNAEYVSSTTPSMSSTGITLDPFTKLAEGRNMMLLLHLIILNQKGGSWCTASEPAREGITAKKKKVL